MTVPRRKKIRARKSEAQTKASVLLSKDISIEDTSFARTKNISPTEMYTHLDKKNTNVKTNTKFLALVTILGICAGSMILLGGGCSLFKKEVSSNATPEVTPRQVREHMEEQIRANEQQVLASQRTTFTVSSIGSFKVSYPQQWSARELTEANGFVFSGSKKGEYVAIVKQPISSKTSKTTSGSSGTSGGTGTSADSGTGETSPTAPMSQVIIDGNILPVEHIQAEDGVIIYTVHVPLNDEEELLVYGTPENLFTEIASSVTFTVPTIPTSSSTTQTPEEAVENCIHIIPDATQGTTFRCY